MVTQRDPIGDHFDARASHYAQGHSWVTDSVSLEPILSLLAHCASGVAVEIGAGSGAVASAIAESPVRLRSYLGVDASPSMVRRHVAHAPAVVGDAHHLPVASGRVDVVICRQSFHYLRSPDVALAEVSRVLGPGGRLLIAQIVPFQERLDEAWWATGMSIRQPLRRHLWTGARLCDAVTGAGFYVESVADLRRRTSLNQWMDRYPLGPAARGALVRHFAMTPPPVKALRAFDESGGDVAYDLRWIFITTRASRTSRRPS
ncbi:class I SAM-dependent methyltransferase [Phytohabitans suffuscus]|uniref:Methyltransferase type 11 domain-containing protein n=1 Tax=Phytohabitans suffuscus TaxID=624315 RepID=A0A6F8YC81_9ACTN|nr:class I SAM-dependent methyltransferase [Phytohabitans suffuscus]BCB83712.1 hypothetical protein Psuf_010250 [Phytohabitans suffuscus]